MNFLILEFSHETSVFARLMLNLILMSVRCFCCFYLYFARAVLLFVSVVMAAFRALDLYQHRRNSWDERRSAKWTFMRKCKSLQTMRKAINDHVLHILTMILHIRRINRRAKRYTQSTVFNQVGAFSIHMLRECVCDKRRVNEFLFLLLAIGHSITIDLI